MRGSLIVTVLVLSLGHTANAQIVGLGDLPGGDFYSEATGVSADGSVVVGFGASDNGDEAFRWTSEGMVGLGVMPGGEFPFSWATGVSSDGLVVVGFSDSISGVEAFRWTKDGGMIGLGDLPGGDFYSEATGVSSDGSVVVGFSDSSIGGEAFRWTSEGMVGLGVMPGGEFPFSWATGVSSDGSVVVGFSDSINGVEAFRWTHDGGMESLFALLSLQGDDLSHWQSLDFANGVSADGKTIVGSGVNFRGEDEAFIATIHSVPVHGDANGDGSFDFSDIEAFFLAITDLPAYTAQFPNVTVSQLDMNADGNADFSDIESFFFALTGG